MAEEYFATGVGPGRELDHKREEKAAPSLLVRVSKVKVEVCNGCQSGVAQDQGILDNRGARRK